MGKTSLAAQFTKGRSLFILDDNERGIEDLKQCGLVDADQAIYDPLPDWQGLMDVCDVFINTPQSEHGYSTVIFEGVTGFEKFCWRHCCHEDYNDNWGKSKDGFMNYFQGPRLAGKKYWPDLMDKWEAIRNTGVHVVVTGHTHIKPTENLGGDNYNSEQCYCDKETWNAMHLAFESILMLTMEVPTEKKGLKTEVIGAGERYIRCDKNPYYDAKNRYGIQHPIACGLTPESSYLAFCKAAGLDPETLYFK